jgi:hypothetical protein
MVLRGSTYISVCRNPQPHLPLNERMMIRAYLSFVPAFVEAGRSFLDGGTALLCKEISPTQIPIAERRDRRPLCEPGTRGAQIGASRPLRAATRRSKCSNQPCACRRLVVMGSCTSRGYPVAVCATRIRDCTSHRALRGRKKCLGKSHLRANAT